MLQRYIGGHLVAHYSGYQRRTREAFFTMQTDGWLSEQSAKVYEVSTETLFLGRQDAMQRQTLVPLAKWMSGRPASGRGVRALEVAAGTGRFATFMKVVNVSWLAIISWGCQSQQGW